MDSLNDMDFQYEDGLQTGSPTPDSPDELPAGLSALDPSALNKILVDIGLDEEDAVVLHWNVADWNSLGTRVSSPEFECAGYRFRILMFPWGNGAGAVNQVSMYLECADFSNPLPELSQGEGKLVVEGDLDAVVNKKTVIVPAGTVIPDPTKRSYPDHVCIQFALALSNPTDPTIMTQTTGNHRYTADEVDWGFTRMADLKGLATPFPGKDRPIIEKQAVRISAYVRAIKDEKGVLWHNFVNYDSKKATGYVGIKNQGATCYMNSLLQSLFCTNMFRRAVYEIPTEGEKPSDSVALALQRVFYHLQSSDQPVGTTELTKSFGWKSLDSFLQHDVQEFNRVLQDKLEEKMKGTAADGMIAKLFLGKMKSYIKCINVDFESNRTEDFYDIQLNVKGMSTLLDSFRDYVQVERLDGENQYAAEGYGLQDVMKGVIFESLPPVLHLQLKRFEYDMERDAMVKINDRHEFPTEIDLGEFIDKDSPVKDQDWKYSLHGVLVHSGDLSGGHYFALLKPDPDGEWFKFDDDRVTPATEREVFEDNFGGAPHIRGQPLPTVEGQKPVKRFTNAYMLVYVRNADMGTVLKPFGPDDIPSHLANRIEQERLEYETRKREREEQYLYLNVRSIDLAAFQQYQGFDLARVMDRTPVTLADTPLFRVLKTEPFQNVKAQLAQHYNLDRSEFRVWVLVNRQNKTVRPDEVVDETDVTLTIEQARERYSVRTSELRVFLEPIASIPASALTRPDAYSLLFLKHFDPVEQSLLGLQAIYVKNSELVGSLAARIAELMGWSNSTQVRLYEEIKPGMIDPMKTESTFAASEIQNGDIVCFQAAIPLPKINKLEADGLSPDPIHFYDFLMHKLEVTFKLLPGSSKPSKEFVLPLNKRLGHDDLALRVSKVLGCDPTKIQFTLANGPNHTPLQPMKSNAPMAVYDIAMASYYSGNEGGPVVYYDQLEVPLIELEAKRSLKIYWMGLNNKEEQEHTYLLHKSTTFSQIQAELSRVQQLPKHPRVPVLLPAKNNQDGKEEELVPGYEGLPSTSIAYDIAPETRVRLSQVSDDGRSQYRYRPNETIVQLEEETELYAEEVPGDEIELLYARAVDATLPPDLEGRTLVGVCHFTKDILRPNGVPFRFVLIAGEKLSELKRRMRARLGLTSKDFAKVKFAVVNVRGYEVPEYLDDEECVPYDSINPSEQLLALDHIDRSHRGHRLAQAAARDHGIHIRS